MKHILIIASLAILAVSSLPAQTITFTATHNITAEPVEPDSIRVFRADMSFDTTLVGVNVLDFSPVTDVEDGSIISTGVLASSCRPNAFESSTAFDVAVPQSGDVQIIVTDALGNRAAAYSSYLPQDIYTFRFNGSCLPPGLYFISISSGAGRKTIKAMKYGAAYGDNCSIELSGTSNVFIQDKSVPSEYISSFKDRYTFIVYAKSYYPDTLEKVEVWDGKEYRFGLEPFSKWEFSGMKIKARFNKVVKYRIQKDHADRNGGPDLVTIDTTSSGIYKDFEFNQSFYLDPASICRLTYSVQDTIRYCKYNGITQYGKCNADIYTYFDGYHVEFIIDERNNTIKDFTYYHYIDEKIQWGRLENGSNICVEKMKFTKRQDGGLSIRLNSNEMKTNNDIYFNWWISDRSRSRYTINEGASEILDFGDDSYIEIELKP